VRRKLQPKCTAMRRDDEFPFRVRPGKPRVRKGRSEQLTLSFTKQVTRAISKQGGDPRGLFRDQGSRNKSSNRGGGDGIDVHARSAGRFNARGRGRQAAASLPRENSWSTPKRGMRFRGRRVIVKARVVRMSGSKGRAIDSHLRYLQRDGVNREGERGQVYAGPTNSADLQEFVERSRDDRHQFRFIVAPEDSTELGDLKEFTRNLMRKMERGSTGSRSIITTPATHTPIFLSGASRTTEKS
jgi:hypothetical protein